MKKVVWTDTKGFQHISCVRDNDNESQYAKGIPNDPPDIRALDWDGIIKDLHNALVERGLLTWADVQRQGTGVAGAITSVLRPRIIALYRTSPNGGDIQEAKP